MSDSSRRQFLAVGGGVLAGLGLGGLYKKAQGSDVDSAIPIRPPGADTEPHFLSACIRCGLCVEVCPWDTLKLADLTKGASAGTPLVNTREIPCYMCEGYDEPLCIKVCPTNALKPVEKLIDIDMGYAVIDRELCWAYNGIVCRTCWEACPWRNEILILNERLRPRVSKCSCVGCGLCDYACPTDPSSITIKARGWRRGLKETENEVKSAEEPYEDQEAEEAVTDPLSNDVDGGPDQ